MVECAALRFLPFAVVVEALPVADLPEVAVVGVDGSGFFPELGVVVEAVPPVLPLFFRIFAYF